VAAFTLEISGIPLLSTKVGTAITTRSACFIALKPPEKDNFFAVQFDPFSSGDSGKKIIENFINL